MCFSATASLTASALLTASGILAHKKVTNPNLRLFASIPLLFAAQQCAEGIVWLTHTTNPTLAHQAAYGFLFFAFILWPVWIPLSLLPTEQHPTRALLLKISLALGAAFATLSTWYLFTQSITINVINCSIAYHMADIGLDATLARVWYLSAAIAPFFVSSLKRIWIVGAAIMLGYALADAVYTHTFVSVWCFFAAVISCVVVWVVTENK